MAIKDSRAEAIADAMLRNQQMEHAQAYLTRGRRFAQADVERLTGLWAAAFQKWFTGGGEDDQREMDDAASEFFLRGLDLPKAAIREELGQAQAMIRGSEPNQAAVVEKVAEFLASLKAPKN